ncbi:MAG TPA: hypothetical protein VHE81_04210, partial [Lacipirellulaceae bacterium]|nr:hypothetical protein [Lacipirellulaceae bacterium]
MKSQVFIGVLIAAWPLVGFAQSTRTAATSGSPPAIAQLEQTLEQLIARAEPSVVAVSRMPARKTPDGKANDIFRELRDSEGRADTPAVVAAGVFIDPAGLVLTDYLAVHEGDQHTITTVDRSTYPATIRAADPRSGLAVLAIDTQAASLIRTRSAANKATASSFPA